MLQENNENEEKYRQLIADNWKGGIIHQTSLGINVPK